MGIGNFGFAEMSGTGAVLFDSEAGVNFPVCRQEE